MSTVGAFTPDGCFTLAGAPSGPLSGIGLAVKDIYDIEGRVTGCGNPDWARSHPPADRTADAVSRLLDAGATVVGKTITDELAFSLAGDNAHYGAPINAAAPDRITAGSSGGSAAAVAAGEADLALGTDTGGSVRTPASFCGLIGIRTTHGAVSLSGVMPLAPSFDTVGWFSADARLFAAAADILLPPSETRLNGSVCLPRDLWAWCDDTIAAAARPLAEQAVLGLERDEGDLTDMPSGALPGALLDPFRFLQGAEVWAQHGEWIERQRPRFGSGVRERFAWTATIAPAQVKTARGVAAEFRAMIDRRLAGGRIAIFPTAPVDPPLRGQTGQAMEDYRRHVLALNAVSGLAGLPQVTVPAGRTAAAPVGLSVLGPRGADRELVAVALDLLRELGGKRQVRGKFTGN